jgi:hypothetical protein
MRKVIIAVLLVVVFTLAFAGPVIAGGNGAFRGEAADPKYPQLGTITYLSNKAGYHFWFTVSADLGVYEAGHSYHNVYKLKVDDPSEWAGPIDVGGNPERPPYNQVGHEGEQVYYKIFDTTTDTQIVP